MNTPNEYFEQRNGRLHAESLPLNELAARFGTPLYVYSEEAFSRRYQDYANALGDHPGLVCYAVKANSNIAILNLLARQGAGFDIVSEGELERVLLAGGDPAKVVFSGVGKTPAEMRRALEVGVHCFNVESEAELEVLAQVAADIGKQAQVSLRVNPDVDANTHPYISTGLKENKFGIDITQAPRVYARAAELPSLKVVGVDCHIGSQLTELTPFVDALDRVLALVDQLAEQGIVIEHLDLGGGLGVTYGDEQPPAVADYMAAIKQRLGQRELALIFEPGRSIAANAGVLVTKVEYLKPTEHRNFAIIDAAMNDNIRPSLYQAWQEVKPVEARSGEDTLTWDLVGPVCETGDFLAKERQLDLQVGDLLALMSSGAYGFTMSSNYNSRPRAAEVMVSGDQAHLIRARESLADLTRGEQLLPESK
ncbi:diaminopimelate decarboxylase [Pseudomaricurvus alkylphenolicus]|jgi:diaminopimelate decarboxylase|uniref:diaminopimelate decarboxylase n=1 Tax=Pseudomaricurvus alkylphenolicus TaxID=1306991 RepID=UPI00141F267B|nr:diaminopimelate decarboxylase [Pseudomaricurvus alkylphenolicus]NIB39411.1 diaminopimelate decarboxylase [Pseudomaricurvus alkylphenolicus]